MRQIKSILKIIQGNYQAKNKIGDAVIGDWEDFKISRISIKENLAFVGSWLPAARISFYLDKVLEADKYGSASNVYYVLRKK